MEYSTRDALVTQVSADAPVSAVAWTPLQDISPFSQNIAHFVMKCLCGGGDRAWREVVALAGPISSKPLH